MANQLVRLVAAAAAIAAAGTASAQSPRPGCTLPAAVPGPPLPPSVISAIPAPAIAARLLGAHNRARALVGVPPLAWDARLALAAASWGPELARLGRPVHSPRATRVCQRENLLQSLPGQSPEAMVGVWLAERANFVPGIFPAVSRTGNWSDVAHYSQVVWRRTTRVGCAIYRDPRFDWLICRYSPPGNIDGQPVY